MPNKCHKSVCLKQGELKRIISCSQNTKDPRENLQNVGNPNQQNFLDISNRCSTTNKCESRKNEPARKNHKYSKKNRKELIAPCKEKDITEYSGKKTQQLDELMQQKIESNVKVKMIVLQKDIKQIIYDMIVSPIQIYSKWAKKTNQTEHPASGYAAQHIVSLLINEKGTKSAGRGLDIESGSEIKTCSRVGQTDNCKKCKARVYKTENKCSKCNSANIQRKQDSKWLFAIHNNEDIDKLCKNERILLFLEDYPEFDNGNFKKVKLQLFEIYPNMERHKNFRNIIQQYYDEIYSVNKQKGKRPAPKNFWPYKYEFYMCLPILTFSAVIDDIYSVSLEDIRIEKYVGSEVDRATIIPELMPKKLCENKKGCYTLEEILNMELRVVRTGE